ncbi:sn-glycerol 3-phosphate transport system ATP-binding protein OS=Castellaniella defragrans OX=75697 GN=HNR28_002827 PE=4 SV=1 [Castellaniella defragrans]
MRMIAGLDQHTHGQIFINGRDVSGVPAKDRDIAMVFQSYALYPHMTVRENMGFSLRLKKYSKADINQRVNDAAAILDIQKLLDRRPKDLSGGQRQRVALGRAIVRQPQVFLMDEPLSNLDAKLRVDMRAEIVKLHHQLGVTTFYVTHDQIEAMTMGQRIAVMRDGVVQQLDPPNSLYKKPLNVFVAGFIGTPSMNFLVAAVEGKRVSGDGFSMLLDDMKREAIGERRKVLVGIRPEHLHSATGSTPDCHFTGAVEVVEPVGSFTMIQVRVGGVVVTAQIGSSEPVRIGDPIVLTCQSSQLYLFDPRTELALSGIDDPGVAV